MSRTTENKFFFSFFSLLDFFWIFLFLFFWIFLFSDFFFWIFLFLFFGFSFFLLFSDFFFSILFGFFLFYDRLTRVSSSSPHEGAYLIGLTIQMADQKGFYLFNHHPLLGCLLDWSYNPNGQSKRFLSF